jgi:glyoxylase-like metal-dependent hydrolase (beta-lactamase superfamily II)
MVDELLEDGQTLPALRNPPTDDYLQALATPGHTPGHLSFYSPSVGVLFCGDSLRCDRGQVRIPSGMNTWDVEKARESACRQQALNARFICAGHGPVVREPGTVWA